MSFFLKFSSFTSQAMSTKSMLLLSVPRHLRTEGLWFVSPKSLSPDSSAVVDVETHFLCHHLYTQSDMSNYGCPSLSVDFMAWKASSHIQDGKCALGHERSDNYIEFSTPWRWRSCDQYSFTSVLVPLQSYNTWGQASMEQTLWVLEKVE